MLAPLLLSCYQDVDKCIFSTFVERWHREISSFHLLIEETTKILDDVSSLLHFHIMGAFWTHLGGERETAYALLTELLRVPGKEAMIETSYC